MEPALVRAVERCLELEGQIKVTEARRQVLQAQLVEARRVAELEQQKMDSVLGAAEADISPVPPAETAVLTAFDSDEEQEDREKGGREKDKEENGAGTGGRGA
ncbi:hypothetical protein NliqN6_4711 [Naganishia liquefaciens]|uniref:Uncharacterized protein n=1 Tax=Naganishia liquefaciens TaxID=104408 RepID=A0A8H3TY47_9TREE|nr:hypothetical protein NliqN6_4711 [Naganishia liquefaciens]